MFTAKQTRLLNTLGLVSDNERMDMYEVYCEVDCEMRANGCPGSTFTQWLQHKIDFALMLSKRNSEKTLKQMA
jgi:hypothetical protein